MNDLIEALMILNKYDNPPSPVHCEHDIMLIMVDPDLVSDEDKGRLEDLGVFVSTEHPECFASYKFGSA